MAAPVGSLVVRITSDVRGMNSGLSKARGGVKNLGNEAQRQTRQIRNMVAAMTAVATVATGLLGRSFVQAASTSEQLRVRLRVLLGSVDEGNRLFKEMSGFASRVPFEFEEIMESATMLAGIMKGGVDEIKQWMPLIGDLAATTGLSIKETTEQVQRMLSAGAASADKFRERGVLAMLGFTAGVSVSAEETRKKLIESWESSTSQFRGATDLLARTWVGAMSMISDKWFQFRNMVMDAGLFDFLKGIVMVIDDNLGRALDGSADTAQRWSDFTIAAIRNVMGAIGFMADAWRGVEVVVAGLNVAFAGVAAVIWETTRSGGRALTVLVDGFLGAINTVIRATNALGVTSMETFESFANSELITRIAAISDLAAERVNLLRAEFDNLALKPLPSENIDRFMADVDAKVQQLKESVTEVNQQLGGAGLIVGDEGGESEKEREAREKRLEALRESLLTEREAELEHFQESQLLLEEALSAKQLTREQFQDQMRRLEEQHQDELTRIEKEGLTERQRFERMTLDNKVKTMASHLADMTSTVSDSNRKLFNLNKAAAIATAVVEAYQGIQKTWNAYPYPWNVPMAAAHAVTAFANIQKIRSQSFGGGGAAPSVAATTPVGATPTSPAGGGAGGGGQTSPGQTVNIALAGETFGVEQVQELIEQINEAVADGARIRVT